MTTNRSTAAQRFHFASLAPPTKLALWFGALAILVALVHGAHWMLGSGFSLQHSTGFWRKVLPALCFGGLLLMMAAEGRSPSDFGLLIGQGWHRRFFGGFLAGIFALSMLWMTVVVLGGFNLRTEQLTAGRCGRAVVSALAAFPGAMMPQVIFSGYLLTIFRDRYNRVTAVIVSALLFAILSRIGDPLTLMSAESHPQLVGMFMIGALLGSLRLLSGSILLPAGVLAGCLFVRHFLRKTALLTPGSNMEVVNWTVPWGDPLQGPVVWLVLGLATVLCGTWLARRREEAELLKLPVRPTVDSGFKRVFPFSNSCMLAPLDLWLGRLADARFRVGWRYIPRLTAILVFSSINTILSLPERLLSPLLLRRCSVPDPVFIVGVHRSGTTHLHNLLALDAQFCTPRVYHILNGAGFFSSSWLLAPLMAAFLPWRRPMDEVRFHIFAPQEEEFVLAGVSRLSPYWALTFPRRWATYSRFVFPRDFSLQERAAWKRHLLLFLRKLCFWSGRRPLLKNPYNTARTSLLHEMFPAARFIHIHRHPYDVYRSNMHLAREGHIVYQLQDPDPADSYQTRFLKNYQEMEEAYFKDSEELPACQVSELAFEDLERDPIGELERIYAELGLEFNADFRARLESYLGTVANYQKNRFRVLPDDVRREVDASMGDLMALWGYDAQGRVPLEGTRKAA